MLEVDPEFWAGLIAITVFVFVQFPVKYWDNRYEEGLRRMGGNNMRVPPRAAWTLIWVFVFTCITIAFTYYWWSERDPSSDEDKSWYTAIMSLILASIILYKFWALCFFGFRNHPLLSEERHWTSKAFCYLGGILAVFGLIFNGIILILLAVRQVWVSFAFWFPIGIWSLYIIWYNIAVAIKFDDPEFESWTRGEGYYARKFGKNQLKPTDVYRQQNMGQPQQANTQRLANTLNRGNQGSYTR